MSSKARRVVLWISTPVVAFAIVGGFLNRVTAREDTYQPLKIFNDVVGLITGNYVEKVDVDKVMDGAMNGLADSLDPDSAYLTAAEARSLEAPGCAAAVPSAACTGTPIGDVGIELTRQYYLRVIASRDGSPADKAGLQTGDYVRAIDGKPTRDLSVFEGMRLLRGEPGSKVTLTVIRGNAADPHEIELVRERAPGAIVTSKMLAPDLGYLRIASFGADAPAKIHSEVEALVKSGAKRLIVDIRRTAEGSFDTGLQAARLFVKSGTLAQVAGRDPQAKPSDKPAAKVPAAAITQTIAAKAGDGAIDLPVTLLATTGTSGAAELFAAALTGNKRADLVGERTLGRAGLQKLVKLPDGRGLWLTYARYLTPAGELIQGRGLTPDLAVDEPDVDFGEPKPATDAVLNAAIERLKKNAA
jgi:carboxyl-terminal processing protease